MGTFKRRSPQSPVEPFQVRFKGCPFTLQLSLFLPQAGDLLFQPLQGRKPVQRLCRYLQPPGGRLFLPHLLRQVPPEGFLLLRLQDRDPRRLRLKQVQPLPLLPPAFVDLHGDVAVNLRARDLLQDGGPFVRGRLQEGGEASLGQEHGPGEPVEIHSGGFLDLPGHTPDLGLEESARLAVGDLVLRGLEFAVRLFPRPALAPVAPEAPRPGPEGHFGKALPRLAGHDLVAAFRHPVQPRGPPVEGQTDGVQDGGLSGAGGPRDGEDAVGREGGVGQVDFPFPHQGVQVSKPYFLNSHDGLPVPADHRVPGGRGPLPGRP